MRKKIFCLLCFVFGISSHSCWAAGGFTIQFTDGVILHIHHVDVVGDPFSDWKNNSQSLQALFYAYNYPENIGAYKNLFFQNNYPSHIDEVYTDWQSKMNQVSIHPQAIFYGELDHVEMACIQYYYSENGNNIQMSFLAKQMEGKWYPFETKQNAMYQDVMGLMAVLTPEMAESLIDDHALSPVTGAAMALLQSCGTDHQTITEACLYDMAEEWGTSEDGKEQMQEKMMFRNRMTQPKTTAELQAMQDALRSYVQTLSLPDEAARKVMYYFSKNEGMKAISTMYANGVAKDNKELFADLNRIQHTTQYKSMQYDVPEKPKSN